MNNLFTEGNTYILLIYEAHLVGKWVLECIANQLDTE